MENGFSDIQVNQTWPVNGLTLYSEFLPIGKQCRLNQPRWWILDWESVIASDESETFMVDRMKYCIGTEMKLDRNWDVSWQITGKDLILGSKYKKYVPYILLW